MPIKSVHSKVWTRYVLRSWGVALIGRNKRNFAASYPFSLGKYCMWEIDVSPPSYKSDMLVDSVVCQTANGIDTSVLTEAPKPTRKQLQHGAVKCINSSPLR